MREELELNRSYWDEATEIHGRHNVYGIDDFKAGLCRLHRVEVEEVGDVRGKSLLHLQCHFGIDTLSWARRGARVTGVDFSPKGVELARRLSAETNLTAEFVCSDVYDLERALPRGDGFDIVYASYGVLNWLPELTRWGRVVAHYLKPGGFFYIAEAHPTALMFPLDQDLEKAGGFRPWLSYFNEPQGIRWAPDYDYADAGAKHELGCHEWHHALGDVVGALIGAGLCIDWLHEFPFCPWKVVAGCELVERFSDSHGYYARPAGEVKLPLMFSIRASKPLA
jgi:SAM-dependent methyltransferase